MVKRIFTLLMILLLLIITGCADGEELDDSAHVLSIGVDRGETKAYRFTFQMPIMMGAEGEVEGGEARFRSISLEAENLLDALETANYAEARHMSFSHLNFFVVSEDLAVSGQLPELVAGAGYLADLRDEAMVIIAKDTAQGFLEGFENETESNLERIQENLMESAHTSGIIPDTTIADLMEYFTDGRGDCVIAHGGRNEGVESLLEETDADASQRSALEDPLGAVRREGGLGSDLRGSTLFSGGKLTAILTPAETRFLLMARGEFHQMRYVLDVSQKYGSVVLSLTARTAPKVEIARKGEGYESTITVYLGGRIVDQSGFKAPDAPDMYEAVKAAVEDRLNRGMEEMRLKVAATGADAFELNKRLSRQYLSFDAYRASGAKEALSQGNVAIVVEFELAKQNPYRR